MLLDGLRTHEMCVSGLVRLECRVKPIRLGLTELLTKFELVFQQFQSVSLNDSVCDLAAELRAAHGLKTPDALHAACAIAHGCDEFWTNDERLARLADRIKTRRVG